jgi:hypothetical protein
VAAVRVEASMSLTLSKYSAAKGLPISFVESLGIHEENGRGGARLILPYRMFRRRNEAMAGRSRATSPIPSCGPSVITARLDYLRQRNRSTQSERAIEEQAMAFHVGPKPVRVRRMLEGPSDRCARRTTPSNRDVESV